MFGKLHLRLAIDFATGNAVVSHTTHVTAAKQRTDTRLVIQIIIDPIDVGLDVNGNAGHITSHLIGVFQIDGAESIVCILCKNFVGNHVFTITAKEHFLDVGVFSDSESCRGSRLVAILIESRTVTTAIKTTGHHNSFRFGSGHLHQSLFYVRTIQVQ